MPQTHTADHAPPVSPLMLAYAVCDEKPASH
jgi:hypothetical protein